MKITKNKRKNLFANINLSEVFILKYMKDMPAEAVKVYIYLLYVETNQINIEIETISKEINLGLKAVKAGLDYLQEKEIADLYTPKVSANKEMIEVSQKKNTKREKTINDIESMYFAGNMKAEWYKKIILWFEKYNFSNEAMLGIFSHCFVDEVKPIAYVETVVKSMADKGVITINDLSKQIISYDKKAKIIKFVKTELNLHKALTKPQERIVEKWIFDYQYDKEQIKLVIDKTINAQNAGFNYLDKIITEWYENGLKTPEEIMNYEKENKEKMEEKRKQKNSNNTTNTVNSNNNNGNREQRNYAEFQVFDLFN